MSERVVNHSRALATTVVNTQASCCVSDTISDYVTPAMSYMDVSEVEDSPRLLSFGQEKADDTCRHAKNGAPQSITFPRTANIGRFLPNKAAVAAADGAIVGSAAVDYAAADTCCRSGNFRKAKRHQNLERN
jgi:hypothetical protein